MSVRISRRAFLLGSTAVAATLPFPAIAQNKPVRIGLLTVKTGPLAQGGIQMEQGVTRFLKDRSYTLAGRKAELVVADTGGNPAGTKTKTQELIERDNVDLIFGPLAAFELLAITDYAAQARMPILSLAAAEDMTQRKPNPYFVRASATSAQTMQPLADYAAKELKLKQEGMSILLVEQNASLALKLVDYVHVMSKGQVVYSARPDELRANDEIKHSYLGI